MGFVLLAPTTHRGGSHADERILVLHGVGPRQNPPLVESQLRGEGEALLDLRLRNGPYMGAHAATAAVAVLRARLAGVGLAVNLSEDRLEGREGGRRTTGGRVVDQLDVVHEGPPRGSHGDHDVVHDVYVHGTGTVIDGFVLGGAATGGGATHAHRSVVSRGTRRCLASPVAGSEPCAERMKEKEDL